jgi:cardiolipin synthase
MDALRVSETLDSLPSSAPPAAPPSRPAESFSWAEIERATGSPTLQGNSIRLQFDGSSTFDAWLEAIESAQRFVYFENYLVRDDRVGGAFRDALVKKAREGVPVYLLHDWLGCWATPRRYWKPLHKAGVQVCAFNRPSLGVGDAFGVLQRDHRKLIVVDAEVAYVGGFCVGNEWAGTASEAPWRDTGVEIRGPAARAAAVAFESLWSKVAEPIPRRQALSSGPDAGETPIWLIEGEPGKTRVYRTLHLAATRARKRIWITDAYFVAPRSISEALGAAAQQGVDVRILLPAHNNWPLVGSLSRGGYRYLLESGVRIFEWQGPMMHAKTSLVDGAWCRVGSSNLNSASLMGNWELDVGVLDAGLAMQLEGLFIADLASSAEIVLPGRTAVVPDPASSQSALRTASLDPQGTLPERLEQRIRALGDAPGQITLAPLVRASAALGEALAGDRTLGREDRTVLGTVSVMIAAVAILAWFFPTAVGWVVWAVTAWLAVTTGIRAYLQARRARAAERVAALDMKIEQGIEKP